MITPTRGGRLTFGVLVATALGLLPLSLVGQPVAAQEMATFDVEAVSASTIRFEATAGTVIQTVDGRFRETIEVRRAPGGDLIVVNDLPLEAYVQGIAEMPTRWPLEALKAQAVAARTYAWFEYEQGRWNRFGYDICATTSCQVFRGTEVVETPVTGSNWQQAVDQTAGQVIVFEDEPILARYFSTSGGRTWDNDVVFPSEGAYPYLQGIEDPDDATSPLHRWRVTFTRDQFDQLLARGRTLSTVSPVTAIEAVPGTVEGRVEVVRVTGGAAGETVEVDPVDFRSFVSDVAPDLWPGQYPGSRLDGSGTLPTTMPSSRFTIEVGPDQVVIDGAGWGHGVGLGQYGAMGKAERGLGHREILSTYYGGLAPVTNPAGLPERIRVGLEALRGEVPVRLDGPARLVIGTTVVTERALGTWFVQDGPGSEVSVTPPAGFGQPLDVAPTTTSRTTPNEVEIIQLRTRVNKPVQLRLDVRAVGGDRLSTTDLGVYELGAVTIPWSLEDVERRALPPGTYDVELVATDETGLEQGTPVSVTIRPFVVGESDGSVPATVFSGRRAVSTALTLTPGWLALGVLGGLAVGRVGGNLASRLRRRPIDPVITA